MTQQIPQHVFERLEREWRLMEPERKSAQPKRADSEPSQQEPLPRIKIGRHD
ncbi:hypothetical protein [Rhizobium rhizoryzae]|uniref:Uncharacterized protein n=1 Tax=Rhizobium rhizoryzae TaxID=451876 RepID=A0A7W6PTC5_9HYPH|nr:hypothetical protein [Rhizobium rhizoryzae]MBB4145919.1 hypothetical protein [Rhizobium rhizoryzae]